MKNVKKGKLNDLQTTQFDIYSHLNTSVKNHNILTYNQQDHTNIKINNKKCQKTQS